MKNLPPSPAEPLPEDEPPADERARKLAAFRAEQNAFAINTPKPDIHRDLGRGWLMETLTTFDVCFYGRWEYWYEIMTTGCLPDRPIPPIDFRDAPHPQTRKMMERTLDAIPNHGHGGWLGWSSYEYFRYFLAWFLYGVGDPQQKEQPAEPPGCEGASDRLYQIFNVGTVQLYPYDYLGDLLAENKYGKGQGFYPTPHHLVEMMVQMTMAQEDCRLRNVCDPCVGTGRMLLHASNYSLDLAGVDIDHTMCLATKVNGYLFAPWLVRPFPMLGVLRANQQAEPAPDTPEADEAPPEFAPVLIGRKPHPTARQGSLF